MRNLRSEFVKSWNKSYKETPMKLRLLEWKVFDVVLAGILRGVMYMKTEQNEDGSLWAEKMMKVPTGEKAIPWIGPE